MKSLFAYAAFFSALIASVSGVQISPEHGLRETYDYIVVGAGIGGLVVANRLTEDPSVSVLLVEAGELDDRGEDVTVPGNIGWENPSRYEWTMTTTAQTFLDNQTRTFPQGRVVGGSTILNGLCWTRGAAADFDAWKNLGNPGWGWDDLLPYFLKSENYTAQGNTSQTSLEELIERGKHGSMGPVEVSFPRYIYKQTYNFLAGVQKLGIPFNQDLNGGQASGTNLIPSSMLAHNQSRADARTAYLDPVLWRTNLELMTGHTVTRILSSTHGNNGNETYRKYARRYDDDADIKATGIELAANSTAPRYNVSCHKEIIVAAGAISSPVLLQISGFGPADYLRSIGVNALVDLPGVGSNLQDHPMVQPVYQYTAPDLFTAQDIVGSVRDAVREEYLANRTGPWTAPMVNAVAFPSFKEIPPELQNLITNSSDQHLPETYDAALRAGYDAQKTEIHALLSRTDVAAYELMVSSWGQLAVSAMHTLSRGTVFARSSSIFDDEPPILDPRLCSHQFDCEILRMGIELNNRLIDTEEMAALLPIPPPGLSSQDFTNQTKLMETIKTMVHTEFHPSGTAAMMPRTVGGVVDTGLKVYGVENLRVVDASVIPLIPGGHLQSVVYAIAEKAADIIKMDNLKASFSPQYN